MTRFARRSFRATVFRRRPVRSKIATTLALSDQEHHARTDPSRLADQELEAARRRRRRSLSSCRSPSSSFSRSTSPTSRFRPMSMWLSRDQAGRRGGDRIRGRRQPQLPQRRAAAPAAASASAAKAAAPQPAPTPSLPSRRRHRASAAAKAGRQEGLRHDLHGVPHARVSPARRNSATRRRGRRISSTVSTRSTRAPSRARARCPRRAATRRCRMRT